MRRGSYRDNDYSFGQTILTLRSAIGLTQGGLAEILKVSRQSVAEWESGSKYPKAKHLQALIELAVQHHAFPAGSELEAIRSLWKAAQQKVLLDEVWLKGLIAPEVPPIMPLNMPTVPRVSRPQTREQRSVGLPFQPTSFVGRGEELIEIARTLRDPNCRLLTLLGPGGVGKTRLAMEVAASHSEVYSDGAAFVSLASISAPSQIVLAIGDTLHLSLGNETNPAAHLVAYLSERHLLLVLDNFEHLLDGATLVYDILQHAPHVTILITSRERLNMRAEWLFDVQGLSYPPLETAAGTASLRVKNITVYSAVQLFIQRATQVQQDFPLTETALRIIAQICQRVVGMPLAIELAAAGVRVMSLAEIDRQISSNLDLLATTLRDVPARHRSLRAVFDHSWNLMNAPDRAPFARLGVFRGGFTMEAAEQVAGVSLYTLLSLVDKSLVRRANPVGPESDPQRFFLLEPIRDYALQKLEEGEADPLRRTHALYFLALAVSAREQWETPTAEAALAELDLEHDNMRAALQWASGGDALLGLRLAESLVRYWRSRVLLDEARQWLEAFLALTGDESDLATLEVRMRSTYAAAMIFADQRDYAHAGVLFEQSRALRHALGAGGDEATMLINQAQLARTAGEYGRAITLLEKSLALYRAAGDLGTFTSGGYGFVLYFLGHMQREQGEFTRAQAFYQECREFHLSVGDREAAAQGLLGLSDIARDLGNAAELRSYCNEALATYREFGTQWAIGFCLNNLALAAYLEDELAEALALIRESVAMFRAQKSTGSIAEVLVTLGAVLLAQGDIAGAYDALIESLRLAWMTGPRLLIAAALEGLSCTLIAGSMVEVHQAVQFLSAAAMMRRQMGTPLRPADQQTYYQALEAARTAIGEDTFADIWEQAQRLPLEQVIGGPIGVDVSP